MLGPSSTGSCCEAPVLLPSGSANPGAHTHRQGCSVEQLLVIALAAEVVEVLVRQPQVRQFPFSKGSAMAGVPDRR